MIVMLFIRCRSNWIVTQNHGKEEGERALLLQISCPLWTAARFFAQGKNICIRRWWMEDGLVLFMFAQLADLLLSGLSRVSCEDDMFWGVQVAKWRSTAQSIRGAHERKSALKLKAASFLGERNASKRAISSTPNLNLRWLWWLEYAKRRHDAKCKCDRIEVLYSGSWRRPKRLDFMDAYVWLVWPDL